jgi:hypothetical protein
MTHASDSLQLTFSLLVAGTFSGSPGRTRQRACACSGPRCGGDGGTFHTFMSQVLFSMHHTEY